MLAALQARRRRFDVILISHGSHEEKLADILQLADELGVPVRHVDSRELAAMVHGATHGGVVAVVSEKPRTTHEQLMEQLDRLTVAPLLLLVEGTDDARNLAFTLRSAEALGAQAILVKKHLWEFDPVELARPSSGAYERLSIVHLEDVKLLQSLQARGISLIGCIAGARKTIYDIDMTKPVMLAIGGEKRGLSGAVREICDSFATIPIQPAPSSLALSHAAAIVLAEAMRQRRADGVPGVPGNP